MKTKKRFFLIGIILATLLPALNSNSQEFLQYRDHFKLEKWKFYKGEIPSADNGGPIDETGWSEVTVPHTWNALDVLTDGPRYYQGTGWYRTAFPLDRDEKANRFFVRFEGVSLVAEVYFNGNYLGTHKGGYSAFIFELTPYIRDGEQNYLSVRVDNVPKVDVAPSGTYLYPLFGGIYRPATVFSTGGLCISPLDFASCGVYISPESIADELAKIAIKTLVDYRTFAIVQSGSKELLPPRGEKGTGLRGQYFSNSDFKGEPVHTRVDEAVRFNFGDKGPFPDMPTDGFSMIWTGRFIPENTGVYHFILNSDDGSRLYLDGKIVLDHWGTHAATEKSVDIRLEAGKEMSLKIEYFEQGGGASIVFGWSCKKENVPPSDAFLLSEIIDDTGNIVASGKRKISIEPNSGTEVAQDLEIRNPHLWDAKRDPYLYTARVSLQDTDGNFLDRLEQPLGIRYYRVDRDSGLVLNGKPYHLYGVCRHQEWRGKGPALTDREHEKDIELIWEIGANGVRFAHYQQADIMYRLCDRYGLVAWAEIPNTPAYRGNVPGYLQNCRDQLAELVKQNYNHPSILFWGLYNEIDIPAEDLRVLNETVKNIDSFRLTTQADNSQPAEKHSVTDVVAWNWYYGWYYGNFGEYGPWYDNLHRQHPGLMAGLSEYGAEACITQQQENPKRPDPVGRFFPEQYQNQFHETVWSNIKDRRDIWCKFVWNMFDFSWTFVERGDKPYMNYKGLVTHDREVKKDAFYFYKANWSEEPVVHILSRRNDERTVPNVQVAVYSNLPEVELYVNGEFISKKPVDSGIQKIVWENIELREGLNQISVIGISGEKKFADYCEWYLRK